MNWFIFFLCLTILLIQFFYLTWKYRNPYKLTMVFGKKGSGKTTFLAKTAFRYLKKGYPVYSTEKVPGVIQFDVQQIGKVTFPENSVILIDEVGMIWDNRNFKTFRPEVRDYFKYQRHEKHIVYLFSQTFDIDIKLRNLTDCMYLCTCKFGWLSVARKIKRSIILVQPMGDAESRIADNLEFEPIIWSLFGARTCIFTYIPNWINLFDSHEKLGLPLHEDGDPYPIPEAAAKMFKFLDKDDEDSDEDERDSWFKSIRDFIRPLIFRKYYDDDAPEIPESISPPDDPEDFFDFIDLNE